MKLKNLLKINFVIAFLSIYRIEIFAEENNTFSSRSKFALAIAVAYILMIVCLFVAIKAKKSIDEDKKQKEEKELKPWEKQNQYTNFPFDFFNRKGR